MKRIFKYPTGATIPEGAVYLSTITQTQELLHSRSYGASWVQCFCVWHYFLVNDDG